MDYKMEAGRYTCKVATMVVQTRGNDSLYGVLKEINW